MKENDNVKNNDKANDKSDTQVKPITETIIMSIEIIRGTVVKS